MYSTRATVPVRIHLRGAEGLLRESDRRVRVVDNQIWRHRMKAFGNGVHLACHYSAPREAAHALLRNVQ
jgi:hypothetical protein